jgi:hypothetical protein
MTSSVQVFRNKPKVGAVDVMAGGDSSRRSLPTPLGQAAPASSLLSSVPLSGAVVRFHLENGHQSQLFFR